MIDTIYSDPNFLQHYGVKGMKWGVRHEDPHVGRKRKTRKGLTDRQKNRLKRAAMVGAAAAGTGLAVYGAKKASSFLRTTAANKSCDEGMKLVNSYLKSINKYNEQARNAGLNTTAQASNYEYAKKLTDYYFTTAKNTDARTKKVSSSTKEAINYLRHPERYHVDGMHIKWYDGQHF